MADIEIPVEVRAETEKACLVFDGATEAWIPKSQVRDYCEENGQITSIFITEWLAGEKGHYLMLPYENATTGEIFVQFEHMGKMVQLKAGRWKFLKLRS